MTEFQELVKDAPEFASMERGELAVYAYATYAAGAKMEAENAKLQASNEVIAEDHAALCEQNAKLRALVRWMYDRMDESCAVHYPYAPAPISYNLLMQARARACELGIEVDG